MSQAKNPHDKTIAVTAHIRASVVERCNAFAGELGLSRGEVYTEALTEYLDRQESVVRSLDKVFPLFKEEGESVRIKGE